MNKIVLACLLAVLMWVYPQTNTAKGAGMTFHVDPTLREPRYIACPCGVYKPQLLIQKSKFKVKPLTFNPCSCVSYARWKSGINVGPIGYAKRHPINSKIPKVGAIVVTSESWAGHLATVVEIGTGTITIQEANYRPCTVGTRTLSAQSPLIRGYYY